MKQAYALVRQDAVLGLCFEATKLRGRWPRSRGGNNKFRPAILACTYALICTLVCLLPWFAGSRPAGAQDVLTFHNDNSRSGVQTVESLLTPANVNYGAFGKILNFAVDGDVYAQPLYVSQYMMLDGQKHNVLVVATQHDWVYAIDADGLNPTTGYLWRASVLAAGETWVSANDVATDDINPAVGITGTPVIDRVGGIVYVVGKSKVAATSTGFTQRLHALNLADGTEKLNGPTVIQATVAGAGEGGSTISFNPLTENQRAALLLTPTPGGGSPSSVVIAWGSHGDNFIYHGWVMSYNSADISQQTGAWCDTPDGSQGGIWMTANGVSADGTGNLFVASGNGSFNAGSGGRNYGDSAMRLSVTPTGLMLQDWFAPDDQFNLGLMDQDFGISGPLLLPDQAGPHAHVLVTADKTGQIYLLNRDNMNHFNGSFNADIQDWSDGGYSLHSNFAYLNNTLYLGPDGAPLQAYSFNAASGLFATTPSSTSSVIFGCAHCGPRGPNLTLSANGALTPIVWALDNATYGTGPTVLHAFDAANLGNELYNSSQATGRDTGPIAVKYTSPTIANGHVFVGGSNAVAGYGLMKSASAFTPAFSPAGGYFTSAQTVTLSDLTAGATIYYTIDGSVPTASSSVYTTPITVSATTTINAIAAAPGLTISPQGTAGYVVTAGAPPTSISDQDGFSANDLHLNGSATLQGSSLQLTDGNNSEAGSAWFPYPLTAQSFTSQFSFQLSKAGADGFAFVIQNSGINALGGYGLNLGYGGIAQSVAVKFDLFDNGGEGPDSTGIYVNGVAPTVPSIDLRPSGIDLHSGDTMKVLANYDGSVLTVTLTDTVTSQSATHQYPINIPAAVGGSSAYFGFTGGTGGIAAVQQITGWNFAPEATSLPVSNLPVFPSGFAGSNLTLNGGAAIVGSRLRLTDGGGGEARSAFSPDAVGVQQFTSNFSFQLTSANADGFAFVLQRAGAGAVGPGGGGLGYGPETVGATGGIATSMAVKFDLYSNISEGSNSTGVYFNGASPTIPSTDLGSTGINLHSGDIFMANLSYDGTTLTVVISDTITGASATQTYTVNIPALIGGTSAYAGFTGGSGGLSAIQEIVNWTMTGQASSAPPKLAAAPVFSVAPGTYTAAQSVTLGDATSGSIIYYTTNGSTPTTTSAIYSAPVVVAASETINAIAAAPGFANSVAASAIYVINLPAASTPTLSVPSGTYTAAQNVLLGDATSGSIIYYTTNGSAPTTASAIYSAPVVVAASETINAIAAAPGFANSVAASAIYVINLPAVSAPTLSVPSGTYTAAQSVTLVDATSGSVIYYTTNGSTPTTASAIYSAPVVVAASETINAIAAASGFANSVVASATYVINLPAASPTFSPPGGTYGAAQTVTLSDATPKATIYYTTNGSTPTTASSIYSAPFSVTAAETINAIATAAKMSSSPVAAASYVINLPAASAPAFSLAGGTYGASQSITLADATPKAIIYYTTNGSTPTTASAIYSTPINVTASETINAIATAANFTRSAVATASYIISLPASAPSFSPAAGSYTLAQSVTLSTTTPKATIYYTTNGSIPTTASAIYSTPVSVAASETINAIATAPNLSSSLVAAASYNIGASSSPPTYVAYGTGFPGGGMKLNGSAALNGTRLRLTDDNAYEAASAFYPTALNVQSFTTDFSFQLTGANADGFTFVIQNAGTAALGGYGFNLGYSNSPVGIQQSVAVKFDLYSNAGEGSDSTGIYVNGAVPTLPSTDLSSTGIDLHSGDTMAVHVVYSGGLMSVLITDTVNGKSAAQQYAINIPAAVGGNSAYVGFTAGTGGISAIQDVVTWTFSGQASTNPPAAAPTFAPAGGAYATTQNVVLSDATAGTTIYYTTDGSIPSTASMVYSAPIGVAATETINAMATGAGLSNSLIATSSYAISAPSGIAYGAGFAAGGMQLNGAAIVGAHLRVTDGGGGEAHSAFYPIAVNVQQFASNFTFQLASANADGFAFVLQRAGPSAVGPAGGGLGYGPVSAGGTGGIPNSLALKFDIYNNAGEGADSTGLYLNGASPTTPSTDLTSTGINLHSGDIFSANITYDGTNLTVVITDTVTNASATQTYTVNIPSILGGASAYAGFTGGTGGLSATQDIVTWTMNLQP